MARKKHKKFEDLFDHTTENSEQLENLLKNLHDNLTDYSKIPFSLNDLLFQLNRRPQIVLRDAFQLFSDAVNYYVKPVKRRQPETKSSLLKYNFNDLLVMNTESPFFSDMLFANRFMEMVNTMRKGVQTNRIYLFEGPPGSGKSTFLYNLLNKIQEYTYLPEGIMFKTVWHLDLEKIGHNKSDFWDKVEMIAKKYNSAEMLEIINGKRDLSLTEKYIDISCPYNDHPILQIPKEHRKVLLDLVIDDKEFKKKLFNEQQYAWVFKEEPCHICSSIYDSLYDTLKNPKDILEMLNARVFNYSRKFGYGISIFNPGDDLCKSVIENQNMQNSIHKIFNNDNIKYIFSPMAYTNNGIYAIMDVKEKNVQRFKNLHSIISDGINKVNVREERIKSVFIALLNPEDKKYFSGIKSFQDRIITLKIPYILDYDVIIKIQKHRFGNVKNNFLPEVLKSFAKVIISTRLEKKSATLNNWLANKKAYSFLDDDLLLLKMDIFSGKIPQWLTDKDKSTINDRIIEKISNEYNNEGFFGISGRQEISLFNQLYTKYGNSRKHITIDDVLYFYDKEVTSEIRTKIPDKFLEAVRKFYDYTVLQHVKECIYFYNREQIAKDILNYLYAINFDIGAEITCPYTHETFDVTEEFYKNFEAIYLGTVSKSEQRLEFRKKKQKEYVSQTLAQEINLHGIEITKTKQFKVLFIDYTTNLKQNAFAPYANNKNFRNALLDIGKKDFEKYDNRLKIDIKRLIENMRKKYGYNKTTAIQTILYVLDKKIR